MTREEALKLLNDPEAARVLEEARSQANTTFNPDEINDISDLARAFQSSITAMRKEFSAQLETVRKDVAGVREAPKAAAFEQQVKELEGKSQLFKEELDKTRRKENSELIEYADMFLKQGKSMNDAWAMALKVLDRQDTTTDSAKPNGDALPKTPSGPPQLSFHGGATADEERTLSTPEMSVRDAVSSSLDELLETNPEARNALLS